MMDGDVRPRARPVPTPDPLLGLALSDSQRVQIDSIRATYWLAVKDLGGPASDEFENLVKREQVDVRLVLTPEQRPVYDRHVADNRARVRRASVESDPDH
jgi:hypothetical protein